MHEKATPPGRLPGNAQTRAAHGSKCFAQERASGTIRTRFLQRCAESLLMHRWLMACILGALTACGGRPGEPAAGAAADPGALRARAAVAFAPLPAAMTAPGKPITEAGVRLGRMLYFDARLSKNHDVSCNSCHDLANYGVDNAPTSSGHRGQRGNRNSPTTYNAALHVAQFRDGRAEDVEAQAEGPVLNPVEMAMPDAAAVEKVLKSIPGYVEAFEAAFPGAEEPVTFDNMATAIGAFERRLVTPAPLDRFISGDLAALDPAQLQGLATFIATGCTNCHNGVGVGGGMFQKLGLLKPYETADTGRAALTGNEGEKFFFKVASLRNVTRTAPYFHDGQVATLADAIRLMAEHQLGTTLTAKQVDEISAFLAALTGTLPSEYVSPPQLPASGPLTPPPDPG